MHRYLEKLALARARKIASQNQSYIGLVPVLLFFSLGLFATAIFLDGGMNSYVLLGLIMSIIALLEVERAGFKALLAERATAREQK